MGAGFATCVSLGSPGTTAFGFAAALRMDPVGFRMHHQPSSDLQQRLQTPSDREIRGWSKHGPSAQSAKESLHLLYLLQRDDSENELANHRNE